MSAFRFALLPVAFISVSLWAAEAPPDPAAIYKARCASCHDNSTEVRIPKRAEIATRTPESVLATMVSGAMMIQAAGLTAEESRAVARYITGKEFAVGGAVMSGMCSSPGKQFSIASTDWNGWGVDLDNSRYQPKPGLAAADVPKLKLKWAFGFPGARQAFAQPVVAGGRLFVGSAGGMVYSLDANSGCTYWAYSTGSDGKAGPGVRAAVVIAKAKSGGKYVVYIGDLGANIQAVDAETGKLLWKKKLEDHPAARITGSPAFYGGKLFVPIASIEEGSAAQQKYECCTFRGSMVALDAATGNQLWKTFTISDTPKPYKKSKVDTQMYGPAGAAVWSAPTLDPKRKLVYAATGDSYTDVDVETDDAIMAFSMDTGKVVWKSQVLEHDNFIVGCPGAPNCPTSNGPDYDFGTSPILRSLGKGKQVLVAGQKSGIVWGLDPDQKGKVLWHTKLGFGGALGGVEWGHAADTENTYAAISDKNVRKDATPGIYAINLATGDKVWGTPAPVVKCATPAGCLPAQSAAVSVIPGAVFSGAINGHFRAYSTKTGEIIWDFDTATDFDTVNQVKAKGGAIDGGGPAVVNGIVYTNSGYGAFGGAAGNVLLAFSVDGK
ncbi:MAG TPA: PQQ-binding-like beta-propeller repeat protein [Bryobacteraceae bacterium]|jgi:polyvinyl alcohol dehydrogenase (cytochrome)|nr:PQQ-binding-like beta-propeller repeat protein [Bryobacteraceae bacterium]